MESNTAQRPRPESRSNENDLTATSVPLISVCIPTFNRCDALRQCLDSVFDSFDSAKVFYEVCVSDNASTDGTSELVQKLSSVRKLRFFRNAYNAGGVRNIYRVVSLAKSEWIWLIGDDDLVDLTAATRIIRALNYKNVADLLLLDTESLDFERLSIKQGAYSLTELRLLLIRIGLAKFGFIGSFVCRKNFLVTCSETLDKQFLWPSIAWIATALRDEKKIYAVSGLFIKQNGVQDQTRWKLFDWVRHSYLRGLVFESHVRSDVTFLDKLVLTRTALSFESLRELIVCTTINSSSISELQRFWRDNYLKTAHSSLYLKIILFLISFLSLFPKPLLRYCAMRTKLYQDEREKSADSALSDNLELDIVRREGRNSESDLGFRRDRE